MRPQARKTKASCTSSRVCDPFPARLGGPTAAALSIVVTDRIELPSRSAVDRTGRAPVCFVIQGARRATWSWPWARACRVRPRHVFTAGASSVRVSLQEKPLAGVGCPPRPGARSETPGCGITLMDQSRTFHRNLRRASLACRCARPAGRQRRDRGASVRSVAAGGRHARALGRCDDRR